MDDRTVGFVGGGEMASAIAMGMVCGGFKATAITISNPSSEKLKKFANVGINTTNDNMVVMRNCDIVLICVKPQIFPDVVAELERHQFSKAQQLIISIVAGIKSEVMEKVFHWANVVRTVPNTPCKVKEGILLYCKGRTTSDEDMETVNKLFSSIAKCYVLPERLIDAGQALSGCGPAFVYTALDALADGGVKMGLPRATALNLAAQMFVGAGKMRLETNQHPGELKDAVTSPGGVTICALHALDKGGFRNSLIDAVEVATKRSLELGAKK